MDLEKFLNFYLKKFSDLFDVVPYTASALLILEKRVVDLVKVYEYGLKEIKLSNIGSKSKSFQVIHGITCKEQHDIFKFIVYILLQRGELKDIDGCIKLSEKLISYEKVKKLWENYIKFDRGSRYSQLIVQFKTIEPLEQIKEFIFDNIKENGSHDDFCYILSQWEYLTIIANSVTPESAAAVQTFVSTVLSGQQKMTRQLEMPEHSLWVSLLENYISMKHQLGLDLRKAYKYLLRIVELIYLITGEVKGFLNKYTGNVCDPCFCFKNCDLIFIAFIVLNV